MTVSKSALTYMTESLPAFAVGVSVEFELEASGGSPPYRFEITEGKLPPELALSAAGRISGTVTKRVSDTTIFVRLSDAAGSSLTQAFDVETI